MQPIVKERIKTITFVALIAGLFCVLVLGSMFAPARAKAETVNGSALAAAQSMTAVEPLFVPAGFEDYNYTPDKYYMKIELEGRVYLSYCDIFSSMSVDIVIYNAERDKLADSATTQALNSTFEMAGGFLEYMGYDCYFVISPVAEYGIREYAIFKVGSDNVHKSNYPPHSFYDLYKEGASSVAQDYTEEDINRAYENGKASVTQDYTAEDISNAYTQGKADALAELGDEETDNNFWSTDVGRIVIYIGIGLAVLLALGIIYRIFFRKRRYRR